MPVDPKVLADLHTGLAARLGELTSGDDWLGFLAAARRFHRYSPQNQLLLIVQGAQGHVAGYRTWQRIPAVDGGRCQVRKGEKGLIVLAPMTLTRRDVDEATGEEFTVGSLAGFKPVKVFHQGQLVAPPDITEPPLPKLLTGDNRHQHVWAAVISQIEDLGFTVELVSRSPVDTWNGRTSFSTCQVEIGDHLEPPAQLKTLFHEWAHIHLDHHERLAGQRDLQEVEAESVAYLLCAAIGLDSADYTIPYLAGWSNGQTDLLDATAQTVLAATAQMITALETEMSIDLTPDLLQAAPDTPAPIAPPDQITAGPHPSLQPVRLPVEATPLLDSATGELRAVMAGLVDEPERARLVAALDDIDHQLPTVLSICADAGLRPERTARFLLNDIGVDQAVLLAAMIRDELDHQPADATLGDSRRQVIAAEMRSIVEHCALTARPARQREAPVGALARLEPGDRDVLSKMNLTDPLALHEAASLLAIAGVDRQHAADVLVELHAPPATITAALDRDRYNPATGLHEPLWPSAPPPDPGQPSDPAAQATDGHSATAIPQPVLQRAIATGDPARLCALTDAFALDQPTAISLWAAAGASPHLTAQAVLGINHGDRTTAIAALSRHWPDDTIDWPTHFTDTPAATVTTTDRILQQWAEQMKPAATPIRTPELR